MDIKVIRTEEQHARYLDEIHELMLSMPAVGSLEGDRLELLITVVESYENKVFPVELPDPVDAILFRMHEKGLKQVDLVPYLGTKSRVSEILSRKRPLTVPMIKALSIGLGISTDTLVGINDSNQPKNDSSRGIDWSKFPVKEMISRGWVNKFELDTKKTIEEIVHGFVSQIGWNLNDAAFKRTLSGNAYSPITKYSLFAWLARVIQKARKQKDYLGEFNESHLSADFLKNLAQLSWFDNGPLLAIEFLQKHGIAIVIEPQLKGTKIDGAALRDINGVPVIGLTIRHDRLDNFWFTLIHEVVHIWKHIGKGGNETFLDDLDATSEDRREAEANRLAREAFIPNIIWKRSEAFLSPSKITIDNLSRELKITPAIIAGRLRRDSNNYRQFSELVGYGEVSRILKDYINK